LSTITVAAVEAPRVLAEEEPAPVDAEALPVFVVPCPEVLEAGGGGGEAGGGGGGLAGGGGGGLAGGELG